jgi:hypothetical protein
MKMVLVLGALSTLALAATPEAQTSAGTAYSDHATLPRGEARLDCNLLEYTEHAMMTAHVRDAGPSGFALFIQPGLNRVFNPLDAKLVGSAPTSVDGEGHLSFPCRLPDQMLGAREFVLFAVYRDAAGVVLASREAPFVLGLTQLAVLDFNENLMGQAVPPGREIRDQWGRVGIGIHATNSTPGHPDKAIIYDSADALGADPDLTTPGTGFMNDEAYRNVLIIAENDLDADADGLIDRPDDEANGGVITFTFTRPVQIYKVVLVDVDMDETASLACFDGDVLMQDLQIQPMGNNSVERIGLGAAELTRFEVALSGSGAVAELWIVGREIPGKLFPEVPVLTFP